MVRERLAGLTFERSERVFDLVDTNIIDEIRRWSVADRIRLIQRIWDTIEADSPAPPAPDSPREEIRRRVEAYRRDPSLAIPAEDVFRELDERLE